MANSASSDDVFLETAHAGPAWDLALEQMARPRNAGAAWENAREGMAVRDLLARYTYALDRGDVDAMMGFFTDDCVITNPRGTFSGPDVIRADLEDHISKGDHRFHLWSNVVVRMSDDFLEAAVTAYFLAVLQREAAPARWVGGLSADTVVKRDGRWQIRARTTTVDFTSRALAPPGE
jgi:uncharacterized protein (TIGR02246 family)